MNAVEKMLDRIGYIHYLERDTVYYQPRGSRALDAFVRPKHLKLFLYVLRHDPRFYEGIFHWLHPEVGYPRTEFRSFTHELIPGDSRSMQLVINTQTGKFYADIDRYNYQDVVNIVGHTIIEVLWPKFHQPKENTVMQIKTVVTRREEPGPERQRFVAHPAGDTPNVVVNTLPAWAMILIRPARVYLQALIGFLGFGALTNVDATWLSDGMMPDQFLPLLFRSAQMAIVPAVASLLWNAYEILTKLDIKRPELRA